MLRRAALAAAAIALSLGWIACGGDDPPPPPPPEGADASPDGEDASADAGPESGQSCRVPQQGAGAPCDDGGISCERGSDAGSPLCCLAARKCDAVCDGEPSYACSSAADCMGQRCCLDAIVTDDGGDACEKGVAGFARTFCESGGTPCKASSELCVVNGPPCSAGTCTPVRVPFFTGAFDVGVCL